MLELSGSSISKHLFLSPGYKNQVQAKLVSVQNAELPIKELVVALLRLAPKFSEVLNSYNKPAAAEVSNLRGLVLSPLSKSEVLSAFQGELDHTSEEETDSEEAEVVCEEFICSIGTKFVRYDGSKRILHKVFSECTENLQDSFPTLGIFDFLKSDAVILKKASIGCETFVPSWMGSVLGPGLLLSCRIGISFDLNSISLSYEQLFGAKKNALPDDSYGLIQGMNLVLDELHLFKELSGKLLAKF